ncbi:hypothetical protein K2173_002353 [Erythroxylum novogranatense]|uniref:Malectin-like domain-containing protein n=1 Tax=Erythroxylum novogranatense TaxID=1862640 RepID=A0AAV8TBB2_9ROSI|nr:hypothetical protein K2173_002353 [Erythroxylum novogranatense]
MSLSVFLLWLISIPLSAYSFYAPKEFLLNCGSSEEIARGTLKYVPDDDFISVGNKSAINNPDLMPILSTLRYFPDSKARKYCFLFPTIKGGKYLVRTVYYYGGFDGGKEPPVFDQIVQGTKWSIVNTTEDYANGMSTYYEIIVVSAAKTLSVCLARNKDTSSSPFISALELQHLEPSSYNLTDFSKYALLTVARNCFGRDEETIGFPDDQFDRLWQPFMDQNPVAESHSNVTSSDFWNFPPQKIFNKAVTTSRGKTLKIEWPSGNLPNTLYCIALYFQDNRTPSPYSWRVFSVSINGQNFYKDLNVTTDGVTVYASAWALSGQTEISLIPAENAPVGPVINAGEIYQILKLGGRTVTRDVMAMLDLAEHLHNPPSDWIGDPCLPPENSWTGVACSKDGKARVVSLNLTNMGISGSLPSSIGNLTALTHLHLDNNKLEGSIPQSLGQLGSIKEIFLQNNNLSGKIPQSLQNKNGLNIQVSPGNHLSS